MTIDASDVTKKDGVERRTLIKAAAWAAPVVAVAAAAPAFAASPANNSVRAVTTASVVNSSTASQIDASFGEGTVTIVNLTGTWSTTGPTTQTVKVTRNFGEDLAFTVEGTPAYVGLKSADDLWEVTSIDLDDGSMVLSYRSGQTFALTSDTIIVSPAVGVTATREGTRSLEASSVVDVPPIPNQAGATAYIAAI